MESLSLEYKKLLQKIARLEHQEYRIKKATEIGNSIRVETHPQGTDYGYYVYLPYGQGDEAKFRAPIQLRTILENLLDGDEEAVISSNELDVIDDIKEQLIQDYVQSAEQYLSRFEDRNSYGFGHRGDMSINERSALMDWPEGGVDLSDGSFLAELFEYDVRKKTKSLQEKADLPADPIFAAPS